MEWYAALPIGLLLYTVYTWAKFKEFAKDRGLAKFWDYIVVESDTVLAGLLAYIALFAIGCFTDLSFFGVVEGQFTAGWLFAISWGPSSLITAMGRVKNGK